MDRRRFLGAGACVVGAGAVPLSTAWGRTGPAASVQGTPRDLFPRLSREIHLIAAGGTPLGSFAEAGLDAYRDYWRMGTDEGRAWFGEMVLDVRARSAHLLGAGADEIALVHCTKAGEQIVLDGLPALREGGNIVTNDLHFSGSLHNLVGLARQGIVRARDWRVDPADMVAAMDGGTALVAISLVSNINGHMEAVRTLADAVHARGGYLYADLIQAAGVVPVDVRAMGIDFAACNGYKWLFGVHGAGFLYVRRELQGMALSDRLFPGHVRANYPPWTDDPEPAAGSYSYAPPTDATRYQPGHLAYIAYSALREGLRFIDGLGVEAVRDHSVGLARRLLDRVDLERYPTLSRDPLQAPIVAFRVPDAPRLAGALREAGVVVSLSASEMRVSPAIYNTEADIDTLAEVMARA